MRAYQISDVSQVAEVRRAVVQHAQSIGFDATEQGRVAIVITELATNLIKHAGGGAILIGADSTSEGALALNCIAIDKGPGMADVEECLADGFSAAGSQGTGLGAILRQSTIMDIYSQPGSGTVVLVRVAPGIAPFMKVGPKPALYAGNPMQVDWGGIDIPYPGEEVCGDSWLVRGRDDGVICLVADGLGHGPLAADASRKAVDLFDRNYTRPPAEILDILHGGMRQTRGAAVAVVLADQSQKQLRVVAIGNIAGTLLTRKSSRRILSHNGTVGHSVRKIQEITYPLEDQFTLILMSDGIATSWTMERYTGLLGHHPLTVAAVLYRDHGRGTDDATVLVVRH